MTYLDELADEIQRRVPRKLLPDEDTGSLFRLYALLALSKGPAGRGRCALECWAEPSWGEPHQRFEIRQEELNAWQLLSRGTAIAVLLGLTEGS